MASFEVQQLSASCDVYCGTGLKPSFEVIRIAKQVLQHIDSDYVAVHLRPKDSCHRPLPIGAPKKQFWDCIYVHNVPEKDMVRCTIP